MARVTVRRTGKIKVAPEPAVRVAAEMISAHMRERLRRGADREGAQLFGRSYLYRSQLEAIGLGGKPVGSLTGAMVESVALQKVRYPGGVVVMMFGADGQQSQFVRRPPWWIFLPSKTADQKARLLAAWRSGAKSSKPSRQRSLDELVLYRYRGKARYGTERSRLLSLGITGNERRPRHRATMKWTIGGYNRRPTRRMLGITASAKPPILRAIERAKVFTS